MYKMIINATMAAVIVVGLLMVVMPKKMGKKSLTETKKGILTVRLVGAALAVLGLVALILVQGVQL